MAVEPEAMVKAVELVESALAVLVVVEAVESETAAVTVVAEAMANYCDGIKIKQAKNTYLIVRVSFLFHLKNLLPIFLWVKKKLRNYLSGCRVVWPLRPFVS